MSIPRIGTLRPSAVALALIAVLGLVVGVGLNASLVPGDYAWFGLFKIFWRMSHRPAFWALALIIWLAGILKAPPTRHVFSHLSRATITAWAVCCVALLLLQAFVPRLVRAGSAPDAVCFALLVPGFVLHAFAAPGSARERWREAQRLLLTAAVAMLVCTLAGYAHTMLKGALFIETASRDDLLWTADARLLGSHFYEEVATFRMAHPALVRLLDLAYVGLIQQLWWSLFYFYGSKDVAGGRPYVLAMFIVYVIGPMTYFIVPSRGPVFARPELFGDLALLAPDSFDLRRFLFGQTAMTVAGRAHRILPFGFIAAMPSLHVAQSLVMLLGMRRSLILCIFNGLMLALTIAATTLLGWHYFVDDIAGAVLGLVCWFLAQGIVRRDTPHGGDRDSDAN